VEAFLPRHAAMFGATAPGMVCRKPRLDPDSGAKISFPEGKFCWNHPGSFGGLKYCRIHQADFPAT
jgi:hypothetical protein